MPLNPSAWSSNLPVSSSQLNTDLYTFVPGNNHMPNGVLFHSSPPLVMSNLRDSATLGTQPSSTGGSIKSMASTGEWRSAIDTSCLFGPGGDFMGPGAAGHFLATVNGSSGISGGVGGAYLAWGVCAFSATTNAGESGALLYYGGSAAAHGGHQLSSTTNDNAAYVVDLQVSVPPNLLNLGGYCQDTSAASFAYKINATDYTTDTSLFGALWSGFDPAANTTTAGSLPVPTSGYTSVSQITASGLNGNGLAAPLKFLNNKPLLRVSTSLTTSIPTSASIAATLLPMTYNPGSGDIDNWAGFASNKYTVPVDGVYLVHGVVDYGVSTGTNRAAGARIGLVGGGTQDVWGPSYQGSTVNTRPQFIRLLDLKAGDTVQLITSQNSGGAINLSSTYPCRLLVIWMAALAASNGSVSWTAPDVGFRWQAGTPGASLVPQFQTHLTNDLSFLIQRPYLLAYQTTTQTGLSQNSFHTITMNNLGGRIHGSAGDNYGGWTSGGSNAYAAVVPGWYLAVANYAQAIPSVVPAELVAAIGYLLPGGGAQGSSGQQWGQHVRTTSGSYQPGAEAIGLFYLRAGDLLQPSYAQQNGGATFNTTAGSGIESSFGCVWVSE